MKTGFFVHNEYFTPRVMPFLKEAGIDYYTRWERALGKGRGTEPRLGSGPFAATHAAVRIAFEEEAPLAVLIERIEAANREMRRRDDRIRPFQLPLERIV